MKLVRKLWTDYGIYVAILGGLAFGVLHAMLRIFRRRKEPWETEGLTLPLRTLVPFGGLLLASCRGCGIEMTETNKPPSGSKAEAEGRCSGCARMPPGWIVFLILGGLLALGYLFLR